MKQKKCVDIKYLEELAKIRHKCKCGHTVFIPNYIDSINCNWCGCTVYRTPQLEFKARLNQSMKKINS